MMIRKRDRKIESENVIIQKILIILSIMLLIASFTLGCDDSVLEGLADDDSFEAKLEEARIALDKGEYSTAINLLEALNDANPGNATIQQYLSNAYAGLAGLDTFNLLTTIETLDETGNSGSIDMMGLILGDRNGVLTAAQLQTKIESIENAIHALEGISSPNDDHRVQLGILAVAHIALTLGDIVVADQGGTSVTLTEEGLDSQYGNQPADFSDVDSDTQNLSELTADLGYLTEAITVLDDSDEGNDLSQGFTKFKSGDSSRDKVGIDSDNNGIISETDLENYINN